MKARDGRLEELDRVTIRFAGDSGDGMQLTGLQFTNTSALLGKRSTLRATPRTCWWR
jgi:2-oxoglutarate ferredoxin oxidoreductase subunit alpha